MILSKGKCDSGSQWLERERHSASNSAVRAAHDAPHSLLSPGRVFLSLAALWESHVCILILWA